MGVVSEKNTSLNGRGNILGRTSNYVGTVIVNGSNSNQNLILRLIFKYSIISTQSIKGKSWSEFFYLVKTVLT